MQTTTDSRPATPTAGQLSDGSIRLLIDELRASREEVRRQGRRLRGMAIALAIMLSVAGWSARQAFTVAQAQMSPQGQLAPDERAARRAELLAMLPEDTRRELETFEKKVDWLNGYMQTWNEDKAGAVVALMLHDMAGNMDAMPSMERQMRVMSGQMGALPAIVTELNQINAKMHVITATMGRAGRMMPWMPFSP